MDTRQDAAQVILILVAAHGCSRKSEPPPLFCHKKGPKFLCKTCKSFPNSSKKLQKAAKYFKLKATHLKPSNACYSALLQKSCQISAISFLMLPLQSEEPKCTRPCYCSKTDIFSVAGASALPTILLRFWFWNHLPRHRARGSAIRLSCGWQSSNARLARRLIV